MLDETVQGCVSGALDPMTADWCVLDVVKRNGIMWSADNRRLWALKEAQRQPRCTNPSAALQVRIRLSIWELVFEKCFNNLETIRICVSMSRAALTRTKNQQLIWPS